VITTEYSNLAFELYNIFCYGDRQISEVLAFVPGHKNAAVSVCGEEL
jgi:hypothetical protein